MFRKGEPLKTSSRIALQFSVFTAASTLLILLAINISFFVIWHNNDGSQLARMAAEQNRIQALQMALQQTNKRFIMPGHIRPINLGAQGDKPALIISYPAGEHPEVVNYSRKLVDIIHANDNRWYMVSSESGRLILLDITENVERQIDLARLSVIILLVMIGLSYGISRRFVSGGLKDLYKLSDGVASSHIDNLRKKLVMSHLPDDDEINIVAKAIDDMKEKIHTQVQSIKDFVSHVSHEFKTPLMVLRSDIELAQKTKEYEKIAERNIQTVEQMQALLDGLLILTATQAGKFEMSDVNMSDLTQRVADTMIKKYINKDIILHMDIAKNIHIDAHPSAAESVISNILDNAYKYTPEGGEITLSLTEETLTISDTGIGIPAELQQKIRQPFWQADKNRQDGVGLGLAIVKKLIDVLGWTIRVENNDTAGTKVSFTFPKH